jgi:signal transduction histidine kinase
LNLVLNASDAMPDGGELVVESRAFLIDGTTHVGLAPGRYARIDVVDAGIGMDADTLSHIFDPFFTTKPVGQGTGLGLDIARRVVRSHDGQIAVESYPGHTEFTVTLPLGSGAPSPA